MLLTLRSKSSVEASLYEPAVLRDTVALSHGNIYLQHSWWADRIYISKVRNSAEYSEGEVTVVIEVSQNDGDIQIIFSDDGPGIPEEIRPSLFEKGVSTTGGGFGLYLSKRVVEGYGGSIELIPRDEGTAYRILLPQ